MILQSTPVLFVESIERSETFFTQLGFRRTVEVPHGDALGFVIMTQGADGGGDGGIGIMLQTPASAAADVTQVDAAIFRAGAHLFMSVADLDAAERVLDGFPKLFERRDTFYGAQETGFVEPGGNYVTLAQFAANSPQEA